MSCINLSLSLSLSHTHTHTQTLVPVCPFLGTHFKSFRHELRGRWQAEFFKVSSLATQILWTFFGGGEFCDFAEILQSQLFAEILQSQLFGHIHSLDLSFFGKFCDCWEILQSQLFRHIDSLDLFWGGKFCDFWEILQSQLLRHIDSLGKVWSFFFWEILWLLRNSGSDAYMGVAPEDVERAYLSGKKKYFFFLAFQRKILLMTGRGGGGCRTRVFLQRS